LSSAIYLNLRIPSNFTVPTAKLSNPRFDMHFQVLKLKVNILSSNIKGV